MFERLGISNNQAEINAAGTRLHCSMLAAKIPLCSGAFVGACSDGL